jgi:hypothetical protein
MNAINHLFIISIIYIIIDYCQWFFNKFAKNGRAIAPNVPAVCDVLTARIKKCEAFLGLAKCGWSEPWEGA